MRGVLIAFLLAALPGPGMTESIVSADEFQSMSEGKTLYFEQQGRQYGAEQFFPGRQSTWVYGDGTCTEGRWYAQGEAICFKYTDQLLPQCWIFAQRDGDFFARQLGLGAGDPSELRLSRRDETPLPCPAPGLGV